MNECQLILGLNIARGRPLFCDITILSPISKTATARPGTSNYGGRLLERARRDNDTTYKEVIDSGLGSLYCLGFEIFGRWGQHAYDLIPLLAREKSRGYHNRLRRGVALAFQIRWSAIISVTLQKAVAAAALRNEGADFATTYLEPCLAVSDLPV